MPRVSPAISNLTAGEWSPQMFGQIDLASYPNACRLMRNFVCRVHGGAQKRPGTIFVAEVKDSTKATRLIPFQYSTEQAYVIEMGDSYMRFLKDRGQIVTGGTTAYEIGSAFSAAAVPYVRFCQDKDLMYLFEQTIHPQKLIRYDDDDWAISNVPFINGPFRPQSTSQDVGADLIVNGGFEADSGCTSVGSPLIQKRTNVRAYQGTYARALVAAAANDGFKLTAYTSVNSTTYRLRFRIYKLDGAVTYTIRKGDDSGDLITESITTLENDQWIEVERYFTEGSATGGTKAYVKFTDAAAPTYDDNLVTNSGFETSNSWYKVPSDSVISNYSTEQYHGGTRSWKILKNYGIITHGFRSDPFITETDRVYKVSFWFRTSSEQDVKMTITRGSGADTLEHTFTGLDGDWQEVTYNYVETAGGNAAFIQFNAVSSATTASMYFDDVTITPYKRQYFIDEVELYAVDTVTVTPNAKTGSGIYVVSSGTPFSVDQIGSFLRITHASVTGYVKIVNYVAANWVVADVIVELGDTTATTDWSEGAWSLKNGYPSCGAFYEQRLMCGGTANDPDALWGSKSTEYENFTPGVLDADPVSYKLQSDVIRWIAAMTQLVVGTVNAEYRLGAQSNNDAITPTNVKMTPQSRKGSADSEPVNCGNTILFVQRRGAAENYGKKLRELSYNYISDAYDGLDLSLFAEHITGTGIKRMVFMSSPYPILWAITGDGKLIGMTYEREQKVIGWHYHPMDGLVEDICVIPGDNQDDLYMIVNRTIGGVAKRYIEVMADFDWGTDQKDCYFVDCGLSYDGTPVTSVSGLDHLEGETVAVLADGIVQTQKVVSGGAITLDTAASVIHVGLPYTSELEPLDLQGGSIEGTSQGKYKRIHGVALSLYQSMGGEIGQDSSHTERIFFKEEADALDAGTAATLYTDIKDDFNFQGDWQLSGKVYIKHADPLPFTVLSILPRFRTEDR